MADPVIPAATTTQTGAQAAATAAPEKPKDQTAAAVTTEPVKPPEPKPEVKPDPMSPRFAALAKQTKDLALQKQKWASERASQEAALKAREAEILARAQKSEELEKFRTNLLNDPGSTLKSILGESWYDKLTEYKLSGEKAAPADFAVQALREDLQKTAEQLRKEQAEFRAKQEEERKSAVDAEKKRLEAEAQEQVAAFEAETVDYVKANPDKWELINSTDSQGLVVQVIKETYAKNQRLLTADEAADLTEKYLEEQAERVFKGKKWQARSAASKPLEQPKADEPARTLTNATATGATIPSTSGAQMDRYQRAAAAMEEMERKMKAAAAQ